jgi:hypothetical protein
VVDLCVLVRLWHPPHLLVPSRMCDHIGIEKFDDLKRNANSGESRTAIKQQSAGCRTRNVRGTTQKVFDVICVSSIDEIFLYHCYVPLGPPSLKSRWKRGFSRCQSNIRSPGKKSWAVLRRVKFIYKLSRCFSLTISSTQILCAYTMQWVVAIPRLCLSTILNFT